MLGSVCHVGLCSTSFEHRRGDKYALLREDRGDMLLFLCRTKWMASLWSIRKVTRQGRGGNVWSFGHASTEASQEISAWMVLCYSFREMRQLLTAFNLARLYLPSFVLLSYFRPSCTSYLPLCYPFLPLLVHVPASTFSLSFLNRLPYFTFFSPSSSMF